MGRKGKKTWDGYWASGDKFTDPAKQIKVLKVKEAEKIKKEWVAFDKAQVKAAKKRIDVETREALKAHEGEYRGVSLFGPVMVLVILIALALVVDYLR